jgi:hypothetical protein
MNRDNSRPSGVHGIVPSANDVAQLEQVCTGCFVATLVAINQPVLTRAKVLNQISNGRSFALNGS